jgi:hypothetical protein
MIKYMGKYFHAPHTAISMLESHVTLFPQVISHHGLQGLHGGWQCSAVQRIGEGHTCVLAAQH